MINENKRVIFFLNMKLILLLLFFLRLLGQNYPFQNTDLSIDERVENLLSLLTVDEKVGQMMDSAASISRLGISAYNWWNEALHGVALNGVATSFPQAIGLAATFDDEALFQAFTIVSDEGRAKVFSNFYSYILV
jgi:beta-glucosidase